MSLDMKARVWCEMTVSKRLRNDAPAYGKVRQEIGTIPIRVCDACGQNIFDGERAIPILVPPINPGDPHEPVRILVTHADGCSIGCAS
jgi:hypothetical protein